MYSTTFLWIFSNLEPVLGCNDMGIPNVAWEGVDPRKSSHTLSLRPSPFLWSFFVSCNFSSAQARHFQPSTQHLCVHSVAARQGFGRSQAGGHISPVQIFFCASRERVVRDDAKAAQTFQIPIFLKRLVSFL